MSAMLEISEARKHLNSIDQMLVVNNVIYIRRHKRAVFAVVDLNYLEVVLQMMDVLADPAASRMLEDAINDIRSKNREAPQ